MTVKLTLDKAGRVVIPKKLRDELHMSPGDAFYLESIDEKIVLKPAREETKFYKKDGMWVFRTGKPLTVADTNAVLQAIRDERDAHNMGLS